MFEDSLFASQHRVVSARSGWAAAASIALQAAIASLLVIIPLLHTEALPERVSELKVVMPLPVTPPPQTVVQRASSVMSAAIPVLGRMLVAPRITPSRIDASPESAGLAPSFVGMMGTPGLPGALVGSGTRSEVVVRPAAEKKAGPVRVSAGVSAGLLIAPIRPVYPSIAKAAHVEGTVVVEAIISKTGTIESLHATCGPAMLQSAAIDAVRAARYQPFRLNGEPTEVQTSITVNFKMGS